MVFLVPDQMNHYQCIHNLQRTTVSWITASAICCKGKGKKEKKCDSVMLGVAGQFKLFNLNMDCVGVKV